MGGGEKSPCERLSLCAKRCAGVFCPLRVPRSWPNPLPCSRWCSQARFEFIPAKPPTPPIPYNQLKATSQTVSHEKTHIDQEDAHRASIISLRDVTEALLRHAAARSVRRHWVNSTAPLRHRRAYLPSRIPYLQPYLLALKLDRLRAVNQHSSAHEWWQPQAARSER